MRRRAGKIVFGELIFITMPSERLERQDNIYILLFYNKTDETSPSAF
jgi:hypothetical protein